MFDQPYRQHMAVASSKGHQVPPAPHACAPPHARAGLVRADSARRVRGVPCRVPSESPVPWAVPRLPATRQSALPPACPRAMPSHPCHAWPHVRRHAAPALSFLPRAAARAGRTGITMTSATWRGPGRAGPGSARPPAPAAPAAPARLCAQPAARPAAQRGGCAASERRLARARITQRRTSRRACRHPRSAGRASGPANSLAAHGAARGAARQVFKHERVRFPTVGAPPPRLLRPAVLPRRRAAWGP
jgi:hypothetical protein